jgi:hypothetical protein
MSALSNIRILIGLSPADLNYAAACRTGLSNTGLNYEKPAVIEMLMRTYSIAPGKKWAPGLWLIHAAGSLHFANYSSNFGKHNFKGPVWPV